MGVAASVGAFLDAAQTGDIDRVRDLSRSSLGGVVFTVKDIFRFYQNIAVIGRTTVSTQVSVGTRDPRQIEASQQIIPTVYHVGGGRRIGGGRNAGVCELCQIRALGGRTPSVTP